MIKNKKIKEVKREIFLQPPHVQAFRFIQKFIIKNGYAPEMKEITKHMEPLTLRHTYRLIDDLCDLGYISKSRYRSRSIKVEKSL